MILPGKCRELAQAIKDRFIEISIRIDPMSAAYTSRDKIIREFLVSSEIFSKDFVRAL